MQSGCPDDPETTQTDGGMSGLEGAPVDLGPEEYSDPQAPPGQPLADEQRAVVVYAARNLLNTVDARPGGFAWFSA